MKRLVTLNVVMALLIVVYGCSERIPTDPQERAIYERQKNFEAMYASMKKIKKGAETKNVNLDALAEASANVLELGEHITSWFPEGTGPDSGFETRALPEIWVEPEKFQSSYDEFIQEARLLSVAVNSNFARSGNMSGIKAQYETTATTCANCHNKFQLDDEE